MKYVIFKNTTASAKEGPGHVYKQEVLFINFFLFANPLARSKLCQNFGRNCQV